MKIFDEIASDILKIKKEDIKEELTAKDVPDWDSMNYLLFISELENNFGITFTMNEVMDAKTLGDIRKALKSKTNAA